MSTLTVDQAKRELEVLMTRALETNDEKEMEELYHMVVDSSNNLRQRYGIPTQALRSEPLLVLKTPTQQMQAAGVCEEAVMGHAVYARACASSDSDKEGISLFEQCFTQGSDKYTELCLQQAKKHMNRHPVRLFPPLLLRSRKDELLVLHVDEGGHVYGKPKEADRNVLFVLCQEGPIIPIIREQHQERCKKLVQVLYGLQGAIDATSLGSILIHT